MNIIYNKLKDVSDEKFKVFTGESVPNVDINNIIGVRIPTIRNIAKEIKDEEYVISFLNELPHKYLEENILHGILLSIKYKDIDVLLDKLDEFLIYADNWIVTDVISPKLFKKYPDKVYEKIKEWISSNNEYMIRFGIVSLLQFYLDDNFRKDELRNVKNIKYNSYYVNMAKAWFYSFALIKKWEYTIGYFEKGKLDKWIHNKSIQKAIESYRISDLKKRIFKVFKN